MPDRLIRESALTSATLAGLSDFAERLFWRLTTVADDYGRFSGNASVIAGRCMPLVNGATAKRIDAALAELEAAQTIRLYDAEGKRYLHFPQWSRYQQTRAKRSKYPDPPHLQASADICLQVPANVSDFARAASAPYSHTDSYSHTDLRKGESEGETHEDDPNSPTTAEELMEGWNDVCVPHGLSAVRDLSASRRKQIGLRLKEHPLTDFWQEVINHICGSPFLLGTNDRGWKVNFDWLFENDTNALKVYEGRYDKEKIQSRNGIGRTV